MAYSLTSHKNRRYKPLVEEGMEELLRFYAAMDKIVRKKKNWQLKDLATPLENLGNKMIKILGGYKADGEAVFIADDQRVFPRYFLKIPPYDYEPDRHDVKAIYKCLSMLRDSLLLYKEGKSKGWREFLFIGENRIIDTLSAKDLSSLSKTELDEWIEFAKIPSVLFEESSIDAIKNGGDQYNENKENPISTISKLSYSIIPLTDFADKLARAYFKNTTPLPKQLPIEGREVKFRFDVPSIFNGQSNTLFQLISSLVIQYYISFSGFDKVKVCEICKTLYYATRTDKTICGDGSCKGIRNRKSNKLKAEKKQCKLRHNRWYERRISEKLGKSFGWKDYSYCEDCEIKPLPYAGMCPKFKNEYKIELEEFARWEITDKKIKEEKRERKKLLRSKSGGVQPAKQYK